MSHLQRFPMAIGITLYLYPGLKPWAIISKPFEALIYKFLKIYRSYKSVFTIITFNT